MLRRQLGHRRVRVGLLLGIAVVMATYLPGWWMLLVVLPLAWAVAESLGVVARADGSCPVIGGASNPVSAPRLTTDDNVRSSGEWLAWLAAGLDVARSAEARREVLAHLEAEGIVGEAQEDEGERIV